MSEQLRGEDVIRLRRAFLADLTRRWGDNYAHFLLVGNRPAANVASDTDEEAEAE